MASNHGKKFVAARAKVDSMKAYNPDEAIKLAKELAFVKFDETVEIHFRLGVDPRHAEGRLSRGGGGCR